MQNQTRKKRLHTEKTALLQDSDSGASAKKRQPEKAVFQSNADGGYSSKEWITTPERSFGSNHVVFGGMMLPVSAMLMSCCIETG